MLKSFALFMAAASAIACGGTVMTCPRVETPVLLGPVDRIGAAPTSKVVPLEGNIEAYALASFQIAHGAGGTYASATRTPRWTGSLPVWRASLDRADDIRVTSIDVDGHVWDAAGFFWMKNSVDLHMAVIKGGAK